MNKPFPFILAFLILSLTGPIQAIAQSSLVNGDFQTGDLTGWTVFNTPLGGTGAADVVPFDTSGSGTPSLSAQFEVGEVSGPVGGGGLGQGAGLYQNVLTGTGLLNINMNIASQSSGNNADGGTFELLLDGNLVSSFAFGSISFNQTKLATLGYSGIVASGTHQISIEMFRGYGIGLGNTPYQYIDNVTLTGTAVPEANSFWLIGFGLVVTMGLRKFSRGGRIISSR